MASFYFIYSNTIQKINYIFQNHAKNFATIIPGTNSRTNFTPLTGMPKSKKPSKEVSFHAKDYKTKEQKVVTISCVEFIRRFMMHVLPNGFQKIRYYGFLNNRWKSKNLAIIFRIQRHRRFISKLSGLSMNEVLLKVWNYDIKACPVCGCCNSMHPGGRTYAMRNLTIEISYFFNSFPRRLICRAIKSITVAKTNPSCLFFEHIFLFDARKIYTIPIYTG